MGWQCTPNNASSSPLPSGPAQHPLLAEGGGVAPPLPPRGRARGWAWREAHNGYVCHRPLCCRSLPMEERTFMAWNGYVHRWLPCPRTPLSTKATPCSKLPLDGHDADHYGQRINAWDLVHHTLLRRTLPPHRHDTKGEDDSSPTTSPLCLARSGNIGGRVWNIPMVFFFLYVFHCTLMFIVLMPYIFFTDINIR
jgi:hypothetical protein